MRTSCKTRVHAEHSCPAEPMKGKSNQSLLCSKCNNGLHISFQVKYPSSPRSGQQYPTRPNPLFSLHLQLFLISPSLIQFQSCWKEHTQLSLFPLSRMFLPQTFPWLTGSPSYSFGLNATPQHGISGTIHYKCDTPTDRHFLSLFFIFPISGIF